MDTYFQRRHRLPSDCVRLMFEFATLREEIIKGKARLKSQTTVTVRAFNYIFFRNWRYIAERVDGEGQLAVHDGTGRVRSMYILDL